MKVFYLPFSLVARQIGARIGRATFDAVWSRVDDSGQPPPSPTAGEVSLVRLAGSHALRAAVLAAIDATIDQLVARWFFHLFGAYPEKPKEDKD